MKILTYEYNEKKNVYWFVDWNNKKWTLTQITSGQYECFENKILFDNPIEFYHKVFGMPKIADWVNYIVMEADELKRRLS